MIPIRSQLTLGQVSGAEWSLPAPQLLSLTLCVRVRWGGGGVEKGGCERIVFKKLSSCSIGERYGGGDGGRGLVGWGGRYHHSAVVLTVQILSPSLIITKMAKDFRAFDDHSPL